ncbi:hypothetical protein Tco_1169109, partial [Tanacetum coccineum]
MSPKAVLMKTGLTPLNIVRPVNVAHPKTAVRSANSKTHFFKQAQSTAKRPFYKQTALTRIYVLTAKGHYYNGRHRAVTTARIYSGQVNAIRVKRGKPQHDDKGFVDSGCSSHMTGNIAYLSDFKEFDGGHVAFGNEVVHKELGGRIERDATTASSLEAEQDSSSGLRCQDTILGDVDAQTWFETTSKQFNDPPLSKVNTFRIDDTLNKTVCI